MGVVDRPRLLAALCAALSWASAFWATAAAQLPPESAVAVAPNPATESFAPARGVVVAVQTGTVYVLANDGHDAIEALDARTLRVRARTAQAVMPLLVTGGRLLALAQGGAPLRLVWLDAKTLRVLTPCAPVPLADWIRPSAVDGLGSSFALRAELSDGSVYVRFDADSHYVGGVPPTAQQRASAERSSAGVIRVDAATGNTALVDDAPAERTAAAYGMEVPYRAGPFALGPLEISVSMPEPDDAASNAFVYRRVLHEARRLPVLAIPAPAGLAILSLDRKAVLAVDAPGADGALHGGRLIALDTGKPMGRIALPMQVPETFVLAASRMIFAIESTLTSTAWLGAARPRTRALRPTHYMGPYPPSAPGSHGVDLPL